MVNSAHLEFNVSDRSYFAIIKKELHLLTSTLGFSPGKVGEVDIVVAEIITNLVKHAGGGKLLVKLIEDREVPGIELISVDNGPGMVDVSRMVADGVSTKNTLGNGLGAMKRLSEIFQVYSLKNSGTVILCRIYKHELPVAKENTIAEIKSLTLPKNGEKECGDGFHSITNNKEIRLFMGDGLGHGPDAALAVQTGIQAFAECMHPDPAEVVRHIHASVKKTRGLVGTVGILNFQKRKWDFCGVGNIQTKINSNISSGGYMPYNGIIGMNIPQTLKSREFNYEPGQHIIMCSDGIKSRWDTLKYPSIIRYDISLMAALIWKDFSRTTDDISIAICKLRPIN
jgi:anti-sigma regulatory factor (Ser/Thr protein kinase)